jgi:hypothetical protein
VEDLLALEQRNTEERLNRLEVAMEKLAEAQHRTEEQMAALAEAQRHTEKQVEALAEAQRHTEEEIANLTRNVQIMTRRIDALSQNVGYLMGSDLERRYRERAPAYFRSLARRLYVLPAHELDALLDKAMQEGKLAEAEADEIMEADIVMRGRRREDDAEVYLVVEVSWGVGPHDVERAARRATLLGKIGFPTLAVVAGQSITYEAASLAQRMNTWQVLDGRSISPAEAPFEHV